MANIVPEADRPLRADVQEGREFVGRWDFMEMVAVFQAEPDAPLGCVRGQFVDGLGCLLQIEWNRSILLMMDSTPFFRFASTREETSQSFFLRTAVDISAGQGSWTLRILLPSRPTSMEESTPWLSSKLVNPAFSPSAKKGPRSANRLTAHIVESA